MENFGIYTATAAEIAVLVYCTIGFLIYAWSKAGQDMPLPTSQTVPGDNTEATQPSPKASGAKSLSVEDLIFTPLPPTAYTPDALSAQSSLML